MSNDNKGFDPQYDDLKSENIILAGKPMTKPDGSTYRKVELFLPEDVAYHSEKSNESDNVPVAFEIKDKVVLHESRGGQQKIHCWLIASVDATSTTGIHISRRTSKGVYGSHEVTLTGRAIFALREFLNKLFLIDNPDKIHIPISFAPTNNSDMSKILSEKEFVDLIKKNVKSTDDFYKLLSIQKMELAIEKLKEIISGQYKNEVEIQKFLKENIWMFGNDYVHIVENGKINAKNILDMIPQDFESYVDIIEVKLPTEVLFRFDDSHNNYYPASALTKAISQTQNYIYELERLSYDRDYQNINNCKIVRPKGIILFGSNKPLIETEKRFLRILNSSYHNMQIITYQQLLEKAINTLKIQQ